MSKSYPNHTALRTSQSNKSLVCNKNVLIFIIDSDVVYTKDGRYTDVNSELLVSLFVFSFVTMISLLLICSFIYSARPIGP